MAVVKRAGIIFDFDDTLVYSYEQFVWAEEFFVAHMTKLGLYDEELLITARERDIANVRQAGYMAVECFPLALIQTYKSYCYKYGRAPQANEIRLLLRLGYQPFTNPPREMEGARELLRYLRSPQGGAWPLILFTQGEQEIQQQRLNLSNLGDMFEVIKIVREKNDAELLALLKEQQLEAISSWYVGNGLKHDINPAIRAGLNAVHLLTGCWSYEDEKPGGAYHSISHLGQVADLLRHNPPSQERGLR